MLSSQFYYRNQGKVRGISAVCSKTHQTDSVFNHISRICGTKQLKVFLPPPQMGCQIIASNSPSLLYLYIGCSVG